jgi:DNA-binding transcriptional regulator YdaS (Cro superfamily)
MRTPIQKAVAVIGSQSALARLCGVKPQAVQKWVATGRPPAERVLQIEQVTKGQVTRYELRPDLYPLEEENRAA